MEAGVLDISIIIVRKMQVLIGHGPIRDRISARNLEECISSLHFHMFLMKLINAFVTINESSSTFHCLHIARYRCVRCAVNAVVMHCCVELLFVVV